MNHELASPALPIPAEPTEAVRCLQKHSRAPAISEKEVAPGAHPARPFSTTHHIPPHTMVMPCNRGELVTEGTPPSSGFAAFSSI